MICIWFRNSSVAEGDVEVVRRLFECTNRREFAGAMDCYADDVVLKLQDIDAAAMPDVALGEGAVGAWFGEWFATFGSDYHSKASRGWPARSRAEGTRWADAAPGGRATFPPRGRRCRALGGRLSAAARDHEGATELWQPFRRERRDPLRQEGLRHRRYVVERENALFRHPVARPEPHLGRDFTNSACGGRDENGGQHWDGSRAGQYARRPAPRVRQLAPPHLAASRLAFASYHGSASIIARALHSAPRSSCGWRL